jgi:hypothetical protein
MKIIAALVVSWFVVLAGIQVYRAGQRDGIKTLRESRLQAYDAGNRAGHAEGFTACQDQF